MSLFSQTDKDHLLPIIKAAPVKRPLEDIAAWVEGRRILPTSTPIPGLWRNNVTPYGIEIMNSMAPNSGIQLVAVCKSRKTGLTTIMENIVGYYIIENPSEILYATASDDLARDWGDNKIIPVIESLGGSHLITANTTNTKSRRTGNTSNKKEYIGGKLDIMSSQSKRARRQLDKRVLIIDEVDGVEAVTSTGEGKWTEVLFGHTFAWGSRRKIALFGSPTTYEASLTWEYTQKGDCRVFMLPCPVCGKHLELKLDIDSEASYGLKAETKAGEIIGAYYLCEHCTEPIFNEDKITMFSDNPQCRKEPRKKIEKYYWQPTKKPDDSSWRSYLINALYSPIGMLTFTDIAKARKQAEIGDGDIDMRSYVNIYGGRPYKDEGVKPKIENVIELRGEYKSGTVPRGVLFLTMAVDVQRGTENKEKDNPARLELEILGHGEGYRTWSILYKSFIGDIEDPYSGAWAAMNDWAKNGGMSFIRDDGVRLSVVITFIDSGYKAETVYQFCGEWHNTYPSKGYGFIKSDPKRHEKGDIAGAADYKRWRHMTTGDVLLIDISTNYYKSVLYNRLKIPRIPTEPQNKGFCSFPRDYPDEYFYQLTAEEKRTDGSFHKTRERNEALDCRVYNLCAADVWLYKQVAAWKNYYRKKGYSEIQTERETHAGKIIELLKKNPHNLAPVL